MPFEFRINNLTPVHLLRHTSIDIKITTFVYIDKHGTKVFHSYNKGEQKPDDAVLYSGFILLVTATGDINACSQHDIGAGCKSSWSLNYSFAHIYIFENVLNAGLSGISYVCIDQSTRMLKVNDVLLLLVLLLFALLMSRSPHRRSTL
uniref:Uncharacterized protein n=1 Tax=Glossina pallidipes TaxID=7398 RepID=A0A1A9Z919_GLOPL